MLNKVTLIGNVGADPEVRTLETGVKTARVRIATTERYYDRQNNESKEHTEWHTVTFWRSLADVVDKYVRKGSQIYVEGPLRTRDWTDKDNNRRTSTEIIGTELKLLGRRPEGAPTGPISESQPSAQASTPETQAAPAPSAYASTTPEPAIETAPPAPSIPADDPDDLPF